MEASETEKRKVNYLAFIAIGITFIGARIALGTATNPGLYGLTVLGIVFLVISLANREKSEQK